MKIVTNGTTFVLDAGTLILGNDAALVGEGTLSDYFVSLLGASYLTVGENALITTVNTVGAKAIQLILAQDSFQGEINVYGSITHGTTSAHNHKIIRSASTKGGVVNIHDGAILSFVGTPADNYEAAILYGYADAGCTTVFNVHAATLSHTAPYGSILFIAPGMTLNVYDGAQLIRENSATKNAYCLYAYGNSTVNIMGGSFVNTGLRYVVYASLGTTVNIYNGYFETHVGHAINVKKDTTVNIYGGVFKAVADEDVSLFSNAGTLNIYGGSYYSESTSSPIFNTAAGGNMTLNSFLATGKSFLALNAGNGFASSAHLATNGKSIHNAIVTTAGASPVIRNGKLTLRFKATLSKEAYENITALIDANTTVTFGMLVVPTSKLADASALNHSNLTEDVMSITATAADIVFEQDGCVTIRLEIPELADMSTAYSVVFFAKYTVNDKDVYAYSDYSAARNSRSGEQVARLAANDTSSTQDATNYPNEIATGVYSPYTAAEYEVLKAACNGNIELPTLDVYLVAGGSNAAGMTTFDSDLAAAHQIGNSHIFYSGAAASKAGDETFSYIANRYTLTGSAVAFGQGAFANTYGPEIGLADVLADYYNEETGNYAAIIKYAMADLSITDTDAYYDALMRTVRREIDDYASLGYRINIVGMYWMQGEADCKDQATIDAYSAAFTALGTKMRTDLSAITGEDLLTMPIVVGKISSAASEGAAAFVGMQSFLSTYDANNIVAESSAFASENGIFTSFEDNLFNGEIIVSTLLRRGNHSVDIDTSLIVVPGLPAAAVVMTENGIGIRVSSFEEALAIAPAGATVKLLQDMEFTSSLVLTKENVIIDANGYKITSNAPGATVVVKSKGVTLRNFKVTNLADSDSAYAIEVTGNANVVIDGDKTMIDAYSTAINLTSKDARLVVKGGTLTTRAGADASCAVINTTASNVVIEGGNFIAGGNGVCVRTDVKAPFRHVVNITGGTFTASGVCIVNNAYGSILAVSKDATLSGGIINKGVGTKTTA